MAVTDGLDTRDLERAIAGSVVTFGVQALNEVIDRGVRPEHLADAGCAAVLNAALLLLDADRGIDPTTLTEQMRAAGDLHLLGDLADVDGLAAHAASPGLVLRTTIDQLGDSLRWRRRTQAAQQMLAAAAARDQEAWQAAEERASNAQGREQARRHLTAEQAAADFIDALEGGQPGAVLPTPWSKINDLCGGGLLPGQVTIVAGPTSHGKSAAVDSMLESMCPAGSGRRPFLYLNEMAPRQRMARVAARRAGVELRRLKRSMAGMGDLTPDENKRVLAAMGSQVIQPVDAFGWTATDICRHARRLRPDVVCLDIVNRLKLSSASKRHEAIQEAADEFDRLGKEIGAAVIVVAHINRGRIQQDGRWPIPTVADLKDAAALGEIADEVFMVWRQQDEKTLDPGPEGVIRLVKARGGELGGVKVRFDGDHQRFLELDDSYEGPSADSRTDPNTWGEWAGRRSAA